MNHKHKPGIAEGDVVTGQDLNHQGEVPEGIRDKFFRIVSVRPDGTIAIDGPYDDAGCTQRTPRDRGRPIAPAMPRSVPGQ
jgi:hypothetical protein